MFAWSTRYDSSNCIVPGTRYYYSTHIDCITTVQTQYKYQVLVLGTKVYIRSRSGSTWYYTRHYQLLSTMYSEYQVVVLGTSGQQEFVLSLLQYSDL